MLGLVGRENDSKDIELWMLFLEWEDPTKVQASLSTHSHIHE